MTSENTPEDDDLLAAEYAMRLLSEDELADAQRRLSDDTRFAQDVTAWEMRLASLAEDLAPQPPRASVKALLMSELFPESTRPPFLQRLWVWQAATALALSLLALTFFPGVGTNEQQGPVYSAEIVAEAGDFRVVALVDKSTNEIFLSKTAGAAPEGHILQVWAHGPNEPASSVGLWPAGDTVSLPLPQLIADVEGVLTIGVSEEPPGGSLTGSPSGRVFGTVDIPDVVAVP